jgi:hypothetical protein
MGAHVSNKLLIPMILMWMVGIRKILVGVSVTEYMVVFLHCQAIFIFGEFFF